MKSLLQTKWMSAFLLIISIALIFNPILKFPYAFVFIIFYVLVVTYLQNGDLKGLNFKTIGLREAKIILLAYLIMELSIDFIIQPFMNRAFNEPADYSSFSVIEGSPKLYWSWMWKMWISAAIGEEILFRGFVFAQLKNIISDKKPWVLIVLSSALFAFPHFYQGLTGVILTFIIGMGFGFIYWKFKNIWINILVHGFIDTVFLTLSYFGYLEFYEFIW